VAAAMEVMDRFLALLAEGERYGHRPEASRGVSP
jgi:hypothetical protein